MTDPAVIRAEGRRLRWCDTHKHPAWEYDDGSVQCMYDLIVESYNEHALGHVLLADPAPVGLTEDERAVRAAHPSYEGHGGLHCRQCGEPWPCATLRLIDRLSAAPVDDREREGEVLLDGEWWRVNDHWPVGDKALAAWLVPVSPSVDPEEG